LSGKDKNSLLAAIFGCRGTVLAKDEASFFRRTRPLGFILFARNVDNPAQLTKLTSDLKEASGCPQALILIDQEGGRVARMKPPHWRAIPPARRFGELAEKSLQEGQEATFLAGRLLACQLSGVGINVNCTPVLDLPCEGSHEIISDRAFSSDPGMAAALGRSLCQGLLTGGVLPVVKHLPGHGRARTDSHVALPKVKSPREELEKTDFAPFQSLSDMPLAMTAHVVFSAIDPDNPATTSLKVVSEIIRSFIGFEGLLLSDDLSMKALSGGYEKRARETIEAGCDVALHCSGKVREMEAVAEGAGALSEASQARLDRALAMVSPGDEADEEDITARLNVLMEGFQVK
jgi:beta-N-acetylhexosaminidase